eukprot:3272277-Pyramimonas_sp.AAC.1
MLRRALAPPAAALLGVGGMRDVAGPVGREGASWHQLAAESASLANAELDAMLDAGVLRCGPPSRPP